MNEGIYYLKLNEQVEGPYSIGQIYDLWAARKINSQTPFARFEEMDRWQPLSELTLRISAPRAAAPKPASEEPPSPQTAKPKQAPTFRADDYYPAVATRNDARAAAANQRKTSSLAALSKVVFSLESSIAVSLTVGTLAIVYFLFFFSASTDAKPIFESFLATKQGGIHAGVALIFLAGFLVVAREVRKLQVLVKSKPEPKSDRKSILS